MKHLVLILLLNLLSTSAYALGQQGHKMVCELAFKQLSSLQQQTLIEFTEFLTTTDKKQINQRLRRTSDHPVSFADSCIWPDLIKSKPQYVPFKSWHFINVPRNSIKVDTKDCQQNCILHAFDFHHRQLKQALALNLAHEAGEAIRFISHWFGDLHQPMHVSFKSDLGGNRLPVKIENNTLKCHNMHALWDHCLTSFNRRQFEQQVLTYFNQYALQPSDQYNQANLFAWANDTLAITRDSKTQYCVLSPRGYCRKVETPILISPTYIKHNRKILAQQVALAAKRLHSYLKENL
ncbi:S1/P1 nuclease [Thalassotalea aquiviva]|uniref:S1/P1 nuclease n=1 Tax=Thalassotalea aquiviva TaxID=3242415 RepID=UPI00352A87E0